MTLTFAAVQNAFKLHMLIYCTQLPQIQNVSSFIVYLTSVDTIRIGLIKKSKCHLQQWLVKFICY